MVETGSDKSFLLQKQAGNSSRQPLEVYHLSHDLRGPLNSILGFAELLVEGIEGPLNDVQIEDISAIHQSAQTLLKLINTVVDLSRLEAGRLALNFEPVDLLHVMNKVLADKTVKADLVTVEIPDSFPALNGDRERVEQMVLNLVIFALKVKNVREVRISATHNNTDATLTIKAVEGIISARDLEDLFDLTVEVDDTGRSKLTEGGLQMPLTQKLAATYQGKIWAEMQAEAGLTFYLQLPLYRPD